MSRYMEIAREIIVLVEQHLREAHPTVEDLASKNEGENLLYGENYYKLEAELVRRLSELVNLKHSCINCKYLIGDGWTCGGGRKEIDDPFEERIDCKAWKPADVSPGIPQSFPPCTPEYDSPIWDSIEIAPVAHSEQAIIGVEGDSVKKGNSPLRKKFSQKT